MPPRPQPESDGDQEDGDHAGDGARGDGPQEIVDEARDELEYPADETGEG